jgi:hypothetical protein
MRHGRERNLFISSMVGNRFGINSRTAIIFADIPALAFLHEVTSISVWLTYRRNVNGVVECQSDSDLHLSAPSPEDVGALLHPLH